MENHWKFLLHIKVAYDLRECHDFDPKTFDQVQGHWKENCVIRARSIYL